MPGAGEEIRGGTFVRAGSASLPGGNVLGLGFLFDLLPTAFPLRPGGVSGEIEAEFSPLCSLGKACLYYVLLMSE